MSNREDFKTFVANVSMNKVGAVFALEASRLSRSCTDWHRLLEICSLTGTLIIDEDGCYNPSDFNDQLLLGLKGTMSQAELHFIRARLQGGKLNKAKKGKLRFPLPVGLAYGDEETTVLDPDQEVRSAVNLVFQVFKEAGSAYAVVHRFAKLNLKFPKRAYGGIWKGKLIWGRLAHGRVRGILKNPAYAGVYVYGRFRYVKKISTEGKIQSRMTLVPMQNWQVTIPGHHEAYITWDEFLHNQRMLQRNQTNGEGTPLPSAAREGLAILQGLLLCDVCGHRLSTRYKGNGGIYPTYECNWRKRDGLSGKSCLSIRADLLDKSLTKRILEALQPSQIEIALKALKELENRSEAVDHQWRMRIERADYEAQLAQRRYEEVDPSNRLVTSTLERRWNDALAQLEQIRQEHQAYQRNDALAVTPEQKERVLALAKDLPKLWAAPTTKSKDRKRILRLLIKDITVEKLAEPKKVMLHVRWQGGSCEDIPISLPLNMPDRVRYPTIIVERVRALAVTQRDIEIVATLNQEGLKSATGKAFTVDMVEWIRFKHHIPRPQLKLPGELTVAETASRLGVGHMVIYDWVSRGFLHSRRLNNNSPLWITITSEEQTELAAKIAKMKTESSRQYLRSKTLFERGAV
jgi:DNA invertase Pin-like site-specific DNA recombinase